MLKEWFGFGYDQVRVIIVLFVYMNELGSYMNVMYFL